jgi:hypothetical protein
MGEQTRDPRVIDAPPPPPPVLDIGRGEIEGKILGDWSWLRRLICRGPMKRTGERRTSRHSPAD